MIGTLVMVTIALQFNTLEFAAPYSLAYYLAYFHESFTGAADLAAALRASGVVMLYLALFGWLAYSSFRNKDFVR